ncbi:LysR family transcriptional regulator [Agromyces sp. SYSU T00266]|uniref:LysR family transcriptional regulator n=1 Tax=Agromyces zhanjiangensis TaxID=3158562 RepID=UPI0033957024
MDLRQMEYLVTLADEQQFTRAAAICGVSQSGLSAAIRSLEDELGTALFDRTTRRVEPTDAGRALLPHARTMLAQAGAARDAVLRTAHELTGSLRIGAEQCLGFVDIGTLLERIRRRHPFVDLDFTQAGSRDLVAAVRDGDIDLAFVAGTDVPARMSRTELGRRPLVLLVPPGHPLAGDAAVDWDDLRDLDFVDFQESWAVRAVNDAACTEHGTPRRIRCTVNDVHTLLDLVHRDLGVALVPQHIAAKPQATGLVARPLPASAPQWVVSLVAGDAAAASSSLVLELLDADLALSA